MSTETSDAEQLIRAVKNRDWTEAYRLMTNIPMIYIDNSGLPYSILQFGCLPDNSSIHEQFILEELLKRVLWEPVGEMLGHGLPQTEHSRAVKVALKLADWLSFIRFIVPHCPPDERVVVLSEISKRMTLSECEQYAMAAVSDEEMCDFFKHSVHEGAWKAVGAALNRGVTDDQRQWAVQEARRRADEDDYFQCVSAHCSDHELDTVLTQLVTLRYWDAVGTVLQRAIPDSKRRWAVEVASAECDEKAFVSKILPHCFDDHLDEISKILVLRGHWEAVGQMLKKGVGDSQRSWIMKEAVMHAEAELFVDNILPHFNNVTVNVAGLLAELITNKKWQALGKLLRCGVSKVQMKWVAHTICVEINRTTSYLLELENSNMQLLLTEFKKYGDHFTECLLPELLSSENWSAMALEIAAFFMHTTTNICLKKLIIEKVSRQTEKQDMAVKYVTSSCSGELKDYSLQQFVENGAYKAANHVLDLGVSDGCKKDAAKAAVQAFREKICGIRLGPKFYDISDDFLDFLQNVCNTDQLNNVAKITVRKQNWTLLGKLLEKGVDEETREWAVQEAFKYASCVEICRDLISFAKREHLEQILDTLVASEEWYLVGKVLQQGVCEVRRRFAVERASKRANGSDICQCILPYLIEEDVDVVLPCLVRRQKWSVVIELLQSSVQRIMQQEEALARKDSAVVFKLLKRSVDLIKYKWAVPKTKQRYKWPVREKHKHPPAYVYLDCIQQCPKEHDNERVLSELIDKVKEHMNHMTDLQSYTYDLNPIAKLLECIDSNALRTSLLGLVSKCANDDEYAKHIIPQHQASDDLKEVFINLAKGEKWYSVGIMLEQNSGEEFCNIAINECRHQLRKNVLRVSFVVNVVPHIPDSMHEEIISLFMSNESWHLVAQMLQKGKDGIVYDQAVLQCSKVFDEEYFTKKILYHCTEQQLEILLQEMCQQDKWKSVAHILSQVGLKLDSAIYSSFFQQAFEHAPQEILNCGEAMLTRCPSEQLDVFLATAVERNMWKTVLSILARDVSNKARSSAINRASEHVPDDQFTEYIPFIQDDQLEDMLPKLKSRNLWRSLSVILKKDCVSETAIQNLWESAKTLQPTQGTKSLMEYYEYALCMDQRNRHELLDVICTMNRTYILRNSVQLGVWTVTGKILQRGVDETVRNTCVKLACKTADENSIIHHILPYCRDGDAETIVQTLESRGFWHAVFKLQQLGLGHHITLNVAALCKDIGTNVSLAAVLRLCTDDQMQTLLDIFLNQGSWELVGTVLRFGVKENVRKIIVEQALLQLGREDKDFVLYILPHWAATQEELDDMFVHLCLMNHSHNNVVALRTILQCGVSEKPLQWAAKKVFPLRYYETDVLLHLSNDQIEVVCTNYLHEIDNGEGRPTLDDLCNVLRFSERNGTRAKIIKLAIKCERRYPVRLSHGYEPPASLNYHMQTFLQCCSEEQLECIMDLLMEYELWRFVDQVTRKYVTKKWYRKVIKTFAETGNYIPLHLIAPHSSDEEIDNLTRRHVEMLKKSETYYDDNRWAFIPHVFERCTTETKLLIIDCVLQIDNFSNFFFCFELEGAEIVRRQYAEKLISHVFQVRERISPMDCFAFYSRELNMYTSKEVWSKYFQQETCQQKNEGILTKLVRTCSRDMLLKVISHLVVRNKWSVLNEIMLERSLDEKTTQWIVEQACKHADEDVLVDNNELGAFRRPLEFFGIICFCADDQLESALKTMIDRDMWKAVGYLLQRGAGLVQAKPIVDKMDNETFKQLILPCAECASDCNPLVEEVVSRGLWNSLTRALLNNVSSDKRQRFIEQACERASDDHLQHIVPLCTEDVEHCPVLEKLAERGMWKSIYRMWLHKCIRGESWFLDLVYIEVCRHVAENEICDFVRVCPDHLVDVALDVVLSRGLWKTAHALVREYFSEDRRENIIMEVCRSADQETVLDFIKKLSYPLASSTSLFEAVLHTLVARRLWEVASLVEDQGVSIQKRRWAVDEACQYEEDDDTSASLIACHCDVEILHTTLARLVVAGRWNAVEKLCSKQHREMESRKRKMEQNVESNSFDDFTLVWVFRRACKHADEGVLNTMLKTDDEFLERNINHVDYFLKHLVTRRLWGAVGEVFKQTELHVDELYQITQGTPKQTDTGPVTTKIDRQKSQYLRPNEQLKVFLWAADEVGKLATEEELIKYILPSSTAAQLEIILQNLVRRRLWKSTGQIVGAKYSLHRIQIVAEAKQLWAVEEASKYAEENDMVKHILPYCTPSHLEHALGNSTERQQWKAVGEILRLTNTHKNEVSPKCIVAFREACMFAPDEDFAKNILPVCTGSFLCALISSASPLDPVHLADLSRSSLVDYSNDLSLKPTENAALVPLIKRRMWRSLSGLLEKPLPENYRKRVLEVAIKELHVEHQTEKEYGKLYGDPSVKILEANEMYVRLFSSAILGHFLDSELHCILKPLVDSNAWNAVHQVLKRNVEDSLLRWTLEEASKRAEDRHFQDFILRHCPADLHDLVLPHLLSRGLLLSVSKIYQRGVSPEQHRQIIRGFCSLPDTVELDFSFIWSLCTENSNFQVMMDSLYRNEKHHISVSLLCPVIGECISKWALAGQTQHSDQMFWTLVQFYRTDLLWTKHLLREFKAVIRQWPAKDIKELQNVTRWSKELCSLMFTAVFTCLCRIIFEEDKLKCDDDVTTSESSETLCKTVTSHCCHDNRAFHAFDKICDWVCKTANSGKGVSKNIWKSLETSDSAVLSAVRNVANTPLLLLQFLRDGLSLYQKRRTDEEYDRAFVALISVLPVSSELQNIAIRHRITFEDDIDIDPYPFDDTDIAQRKKTFDRHKLNIFSHVRNFELWEHTRRLLFRAAVNEKKWKVVVQWADHSLYDDQRLWALEEAYKDKQWKAMLLLADHGLTLAEQMRVHNRLAKYADWDTALQIFERGTDVSEMRDMLHNTRRKTRKHCVHDFDIKRNRDTSLLQIEETFERCRKDGTYKPVAEYKWSYMLYCFHRFGSEGNFTKCLKTAIKHKAWHVVVHLVRAGLNTKENEELFNVMLKQKQWDVCRACMERGVSVQTCLDALDQFISNSQWTLVSFIASSDIEYVIRMKIMYTALERREGSVVWHCIRALKDPLSVNDREKLFQYAFERDIWQALKPLVEYKDSTGIRHRDVAFLEAIEQHLWDMVDHCQLHHADINMTDENGETPLHRAARAQDWQAVEAIVSRDGDPNLLYKDGASVLNLAIASQSLSTVKVLIEFLADIHQIAKPRPDRVENPKYKMEKSYLEYYRIRSPLEFLVERCNGSAIDHSLMWCPDQWKGVTVDGETALHAVCMSGCPNTMYYLIARKVDPLAVTKIGYSALSYALMNVEKDYQMSQRMLAECISLGLSTHQPEVSQAWEAQHMQARRLEMYQEQIDSLLQQLEKKLVDEEFGMQEKYGKNEIEHKLACDKKQLHVVLKAVQYERCSLKSETLSAVADAEQLRSYFKSKFHSLDAGGSEQIKNHLETFAQNIDEKYNNVLAIVREDVVQHALIEGDLPPGSQFSRSTAWDRTVPNRKSINSKITLTRMLYESGALSHTNICGLLIRLYLKNRKIYKNSFMFSSEAHKTEFTENFQVWFDYVRELAINPRSLKSFCRLKISHCLGVRGRRDRYVEQLDGLDRPMKNYAMFSDLTGPSFGK